MIVEVKAPNNYDEYNKVNEDWDEDFVYYKKIFLAGSIEMGTAENWQKDVIEKMSKVTLSIPEENRPNMVFLNPRRDDWDPSWKQSIDNPQFKEQVTWELQALEDSDVIVMYFDPNTKSPISLLELGLFAKEKTIMVICPDGFWRKGNVEIVCERYDVPFFHTLNDFIDALNREIE